MYMSPDILNNFFNATGGEAGVLDSVKFLE